MRQQLQERRDAVAAKDKAIKVRKAARAVTRLAGQKAALEEKLAALQLEERGLDADLEVSTAAAASIEDPESPYHTVVAPSVVRHNERNCLQLHQSDASAACIALLPGTPFLRHSASIASLLKAVCLCTGYTAGR